MTVADFFARWRVRLGYLLAIVVLFLARPTFHSILLGAAVGLLGLIVRADAAGYLHKQEVLTVTGPYARTRNPLYFGSSLLALGAAIAMNSWIAAALLLLYFALVYSSRHAPRRKGTPRKTRCLLQFLRRKSTSIFPQASRCRANRPCQRPASPGPNTKKTTNTKLPWAFSSYCSSW